MSGAIIKLQKEGRSDAYLEWSTIGSGPGTMGMMLAGFKAYYKDRHGTEGLRKLEEERLPRVEQYGCSSFIDTLQDLMRYNYEDQWGHRPILMDELWDRYVDGEICAECRRVRTTQEMTDPEGKPYAYVVCFFCANKITPQPWPELLDIPEELEKVSVHDIRADPQHPLRPLLKALTDERVRNAVNTAVTPERILEVEDAVSRMRKELA